MLDDPAVRRPGSSRRAVLAMGAAAGAVGALAGCSVYDGSAPPPPAAPPPPPAGGGDGGDDGDTDTDTSLASVEDIPVGGGVIFGEPSVVITQPASGDIKAFSSICTHQGCPVANVSDGTINCTCHGSKFSIADGSVVAGPAPTPLDARNVTVADGKITLA